MKIMLINGSPRKNCNTAQLLKAFEEGVRSAVPDAEIKAIHLYDYLYTGCKSCFACQMTANREHLGCRVKDSIYDLLEEKYLENQNRIVDDDAVMEQLENALANREIVLIAPGKTSETEKERVKKLSAACKNYAEVLEDVNTFLDMMKKHLNLHKAADCAWQREKR